MLKLKKKLMTWKKLYNILLNGKRLLQKKIRLLQNYVYLLILLLPSVTHILKDIYSTTKNSYTWVGVNFTFSISFSSRHIKHGLLF